MKNVRLFAVAAALGMFASTVAAAETTKTVEWSGDDTVIKVDLGEKLVVTAPTATVTLDGKTTECQNGTDANGDGFVDAGVYAVNPEVNKDQNWLYTDAKYWSTNDPSVGTAKYYLGLMGGRFLAPGSAEIEEEVFADQLTHKIYGSVEECFNALVEKGEISVKYTEDGDIDTVTVDYTENKYTGSDKLKNVTYITVTSKGGRKADEYIMDAVVDFYVKGVDLVTTTEYDVSKNQVDTVAQSYASKVIISNDGFKTNKMTITGLGLYNPISTLNTKGYVLTVGYSKKGYTFDATQPLVAGASRQSYETNVKDVEQKLTKTAAEDLESTDSYVLKGEAGEVVLTGATASDLPADTEYVFVVDATTKPLSSGKLTQTYYDVTTDLVDGQKYNIGTSSFTTDEVVYLGNPNTNKAGTKPVTAQYVAAGTGKALDAIAFTVEHEDGSYTIETVNYEDTDIYYAVTVGTTAYAYATGTLYAQPGDLIKITEKNAAKLFIEGSENAFIIGTSPIANYVDAVTGGYGNVPATGYIGVVESDYDFVEYDPANMTAKNGYYFESATHAENFTVNNFTVLGKAVKATAAALATNTTTYNQLTKLAKPGTITIVDISDADTTPTDFSKYAGASVVARFDIDALESYSLQQDYYINIDEFNVESFKGNNEKTPENALTPYTNFSGLYELENIPENNTDLYVIVYDNATDGVKNGLDLSTVWSYSAAKETGVLTLADGSEIDCKAVQLNKKGHYYPAFDTEEELVEAVYGLTGLNEALVGTKDKKSTFKTWYDAASASLKTLKADHDVNYTTLYEELPVTAEQSMHNAKACDYTVSSSSDKVTVEATNTIDTNVAGVYDLEYAAKFEGEVVGTTSIKVVVAPNYTRTWENGRVKTLTSYYVSNPTAKYAEYNYDWANGTATVTYYTVDGAVADTATITL